MSGLFLRISGLAWTWSISRWTEEFHSAPFGNHGRRTPVRQDPDPTIWMPQGGPRGEWVLPPSPLQYLQNGLGKCVGTTRVHDLGPCLITRILISHPDIVVIKSLKNSELSRRFSTLSSE